MRLSFLEVWPYCVGDLERDPHSENYPKGVGLLGRHFQQILLLHDGMSGLEGA